MADEPEGAFHDLTELGELCGCTPMQRKFAEGVLAGLSLVEAAHRAGYAGGRDSVQLRSTASAVGRAKPVQALLALAESRGLGVPNAPGDREELIRILWSHARSKDKQSSIRASVELDRIKKEELDGAGDMTAEDCIREMLDMRSGVAQAAYCYLDAIHKYGPHMRLAGLPLFKELAPTIRANYPEIHERMRCYLDEDSRAELEKLAAGPPVPVDSLSARSAAKGRPKANGVSADA